jgi:hypothetical protein
MKHLMIAGLLIAALPVLAEEKAPKEQISKQQAEAFPENGLMTEVQGYLMKLRGTLRERRIRSGQGVVHVSASECLAFATQLELLRARAATSATSVPIKVERDLEQATSGLERICNHIGAVRAK